MRFKDKYDPENLYMKAAITARKEGDKLTIVGSDAGFLGGAQEVWIEIAPGQLIRETELEKRTEPWSN